MHCPENHLDPDQLDLCETCDGRGRLCDNCGAPASHSIIEPTSDDWYDYCSPCWDAMDLDHLTDHYDR